MDNLEPTVPGLPIYLSCSVCGPISDLALIRTEIMGKYTVEVSYEWDDVAHQVGCIEDADTREDDSDTSGPTWHLTPSGERCKGEVTFEVLI